MTTEQPGHPPLQVGSPAAVLAIVPHLLGFVPEKSLVVVGTKGPRGRIDLTFRFDLPDPPAASAAEEIAARTAAILTGQQNSAVVVIGYGPGPLVTPVTDAIRHALAGTRLTVHDILRVDEGRYWSYLCREPGCCPPEGIPFDARSHPAGMAMAAASSKQILAGRGELAATIAPVTGVLAETMERQTRRAERIAAELLARSNGEGTPGHRPVTEHGLRAVQAAITTYRDGRTIEHCYQFAWLGLVLSSLRVRDDAWARMDPDHHDAHRRLWTDLTRHAQPGYVAAPASLLAFTAWQGGNGALANVALDRALADDEDYSMALLLRDTIDAGAPPSLARLPMTPEEVAASYDARLGTDQTGPGEHGPGTGSTT